MHVPLSRNEIASFLKIDEPLVEKLWLSGSLRRSLSNDLRANTALAQSSMFDVLELALSSGLLGVKVSKQDAETWTELLCRACDWGDWYQWSAKQKIDCLTDYAFDCEKICSSSIDFRFTAEVLTAAQSRLFELCMANDKNDNAVSSSAQ
ncbi:hypothetical protein [uncultured Roseobacter sp.]|uniref:hypothetical protein n=1 Tax=uncultured Roseobacter sp. TaxID=114847 RepID=UPI0026256166|nr:hypothetical protein [uncultured Roseobacter sp.]